MADNPFSPEGNPFLQGDGGPTGGGPTSDSQGGVTQGPAAVPETTKPRQMPGGASPVPVGAPMGDGAPGGSGPAPMPFTNPAVSGQGQNMPTGTNTPQPTPPTQMAAFRRAVAMRDEILVSNPHLTAPQAFFLAKQAVALQMTARETDYDPKNFNDARNPRSPNHPNYWRNRSNQGGAPQWNPQGPTLGPQSGYGESDPSWAQKARQMGYSGQSPALVGMIPSLWGDWKRYRERRNLQKGEQEHAPEQSTEPEAQHMPETPAQPARVIQDKPDKPNSAYQPRHRAQDGLPPQAEADAWRGKHSPDRPHRDTDENSVPQPNQNVATTPVPGEAHTHPGGPPTPHAHPSAPQPGEHSVPRQRPSAQVPPRPPRTTPRQEPGMPPNRRGKHRRAMVYTAAQVYGEA